ncbi:MAG: 4-hydroxy-tetrahydrodipicolinate synthase [Thermoleophilaceae bacterium]
MAFQGIITAMVTPFHEDGSLDEDGSGRLIRDLLDGGSDGLVLGGTTGEGPTLTDDEAVALWEIGVEVATGRGAPIIAGTGTNDTRHTIEFTERAAAVGVDGALVVTPYYNRPSRAGVVAHYQAVAAATDLPIVLYNIPQRTGLDMPNDLLAELAGIPTVLGVKQARYEDLEPIEGLDLLAGNDDLLGRVLDLGGTGGILVASHLAGREMRRMIDEPELRAELERELLPFYGALSVAPAAASVKAALGLLGRDVGEPRLPLVPPSESELSAIRQGLEARGLLETV